MRRLYWEPKSRTAIVSRRRAGSFAGGRSPGWRRGRSQPDYTGRHRGSHRAAPWRPPEWGAPWSRCYTLLRSRNERARRPLDAVRRPDCGRSAPDVARDGDRLPLPRPGHRPPGALPLLPRRLRPVHQPFRWGIVQERFVGLENYQRLLVGRGFWNSLGVTVWYVLLCIPAQIALGLVIAYLLFQPIRGRLGLPHGLFLPYITSTVAAALVWRWIYNPNNGPAQRRPRPPWACPPRSGSTSPPGSSPCCSARPGSPSLAGWPGPAWPWSASP